MTIGTLSCTVCGRSPVSCKCTTYHPSLAMEKIESSSRGGGGGSGSLEAKEIKPVTGWVQSALEEFIGETQDTGGAIKHDDGKDDFTHVSIEMMTALARVRAFGAKKYSRDNWKKGFKIVRSLGAALRHIFARLAGQKLDPESGLDHLWHAACCIEHAIYDAAHHPQNEIGVIDENEKS